MSGHEFKGDLSEVITLAKEIVQTESIPERVEGRKILGDYLLESGLEWLAYAVFADPTFPRQVAALTSVDDLLQLDQKAELSNGAREWKRLEEG